MRELLFVLLLGVLVVTESCILTRSTPQLTGWRAHSIVN
jgi:hypothetical protein